MLGQVLLEGAELATLLGDHGHRRADRDAIGVGVNGRGLELLGAKGRLNLSAALASTLRFRPPRRKVAAIDEARQPAAFFRSRGPGQDREGITVAVAVGQLAREGDQRSR